MMRITLITASTGLLMLAGCQKPADDTGANAVAATPAAVTPGRAPAPAVAAPVVATGPALGQATDGKGELRMDVVEAVRAGGVLTIKTRVTLIAGKAGIRPLPASLTADVYLTAGDKKFLLLKDDHDKELMSSNNYPTFDQIGVTQAWWGKFPAPAADVKAVNFYFAGFDPVENVAITDR